MYPAPPHPALYRRERERRARRFWAVELVVGAFDGAVVEFAAAVGGLADEGLEVGA